MKCIIPITANGVTERHECHASNQSVKLTKENIMIKTRDTWTMEITFPLSMRENMEVFGHINRINVTRRKAQFKDCTLYAGNTRIITGTGTVTYVSDTEARLQILAGKEEYRFKDVNSQGYIDKLQYNVPKDYFGIFPGKPSSEAYTVSEFETMSEELLPYCCYTIIADGEYILNKPNFDNHGANVSRVKCAIQPNLWFVVRTCLQSLGYELKLSWMEYDVQTSTARLVQSEAYRLFPLIYICSTRLSKTDIARALPHWTIEKFLQEVESLFNVSFLLDSESHTAIVIDNGNYQAENVAVESFDDFTAEYDAEGIKLIGASSIAYNLGDMHENGTSIESNIMEEFEVLEFSSKEDAINSWNAMRSNTDSLLTTIWKFPEGYFYTATSYDENNGTTTYYRKDAGQLQALVREAGNDDNVVTLNIAPVALGYRFFQVDGRDYAQNGILIMESDSNSDTDIFTVEMAVEGETSPDEDVAERMEVFLLGPSKETLYWENENGKRKINTRHPFTFIESGFYGSDEIDTSLALDRDWTTNTIGSLHGSARRIEGHIRHTMRFLYEGMPDPKKIYIIRGKRFLCEKIEVEIKDDKIQDLKTGYFFEML